MQHFTIFLFLIIAFFAAGQYAPEFSWSTSRSFLPPYVWLVCNNSGVGYDGTHTAYNLISDLYLGSLKIACKQLVCLWLSANVSSVKNLTMAVHNYVLWYSGFLWIRRYFFNEGLKTLSDLFSYCYKCTRKEKRRWLKI